MTSNHLSLSLMDPCLERTFRGHRSYVNAVTFSPNLKQLASASGDNCIMLWNFKPQLRAFRFIGHKVIFLDVRQPRIIVCTDRLPNCILNVGSRDRCPVLTRRRVSCVSIKRQNRAAMGTQRVSRITSHICIHPLNINITTSYRKGESVTLKGHTGAVRSVNFSQDGLNLVTASDDKTAKVSLDC